MVWIKIIRFKVFQGLAHFFLRFWRQLRFYTLKTTIFRISSCTDSGNLSRAHLLELADSLTNELRRHLRLHELRTICHIHVIKGRPSSKVLHAHHRVLYRHVLLCHRIAILIQKQSLYPIRSSRVLNSQFLQLFILFYCVLLAIIFHNFIFNAFKLLEGRSWAILELSENASSLLVLLGNHCFFVVEIWVLSEDALEFIVLS